MSSGTRFLAQAVCIALLSASAPATSQAADAEGTFDVYGLAQADAIYDFGRVNPDWRDGFRPSKIANPEGEYGSNGQTSMSVKQSRLGVKGTMPTGEGHSPLSFEFAFDLYGVGADAGQTTFHLRYAYGEWGSLLAGQANSVFMDGDVFPNTIDAWGPNGMVFYRNVQFRWTPYRTDSNQFAIAIERPGNDIDAGQIRQFDPQLGDNIQSDQKLPDLTAHWRTDGDWGHFQVAGILRDVAYDTRNTRNNEPKGSQTGWGVNLSGSINTIGRDKVLLQAVHGQGIASYIDDGGTDLAPEGRLPTDTEPGNARAKAVPLTGIVAYYDHYWNEEFSSSIGYSTTFVDNTNLQEDGAFKSGQYTSVNLLYYPAENVMVGGELLWGDLEEKSGETQDDLRLQFSVRYSWGKTF